MLSKQFAKGLLLVIIILLLAPLVMAQEKDITGQAESWWDNLQKIAIWIFTFILAGAGIKLAVQWRRNDDLDFKPLIAGAIGLAVFGLAEEIVGLFIN